ncbi:MAG: hypothetical protein WDN66_05285 [Candidatus Saccharibacteria bacterium]
MIAVFFALLGIGYQERHNDKSTDSNLGELNLTGNQVNIISAQPNSISPSVSSSNVPAGSSTSLQPNGSGSTYSNGGAASSPIQNNANLNDPNVRSNPLVQSLYEGN